MVRGIIDAFEHMDFCLVINLTMGGNQVVTWLPIIATRYVIFATTLNTRSVLEINFFCTSTCYLVFKVVAKLTYLVTIICGHETAGLPSVVSFMTKQNSIWSKALIMPLTI